MDMPSSIKSSSSGFIRTTLAKLLDEPTQYRFQQVLDFIGPSIVEPLIISYDNNLYNHVATLPADMSPILKQLYISLKFKFYSFRFIGNITRVIRGRIIDGDKEAKDRLVSLCKILLHHCLTCRNDTANFALVELEQLCSSNNITLQNLYYKHRYKLLRIIIKDVLQKLSTVTNNSEISNGNGLENGINSTSNVIRYMTRALETFSITTITSEDVSHSLVIITNLLFKDIYDDAIKIFLDSLSSHQNIEPGNLVRTHIQAILVNLLLKKKQKFSSFDLTQALKKLSNICEKPLRELLATKLTFIKGRLLLEYSSDPLTVKEGICYLSKFEKEESEQPFKDEFNDQQTFIGYLIPSMIGILLGVDSHFTYHKKDLGSEESIKQIDSLRELLALLSEQEVQTIHVKLLSTLSLLIRLRPQRNITAFNTALTTLWTVFVEKLSKDLRISLLINICVALYDLMLDCPEEVATIYEDLICKDDPEKLAASLQSLFFIPNIPAMSKIYTYLTPFVYRESTVSDLEGLQRSLECTLPLMKLENQKCRWLALIKIKQLLQANQRFILSNMLISPDEPLDRFTSKTIESLLTLSCTQDDDCTTLVAECLGILGAVNPIRLDHLIYGREDKRSVSSVNLKSLDFVVDLIERLKCSLFSDQRSESETANYALQVVVKNFAVFNDSRFHKRLSDEALRACKLCQHTNYSGIKKTHCDFSSTIYERFKMDNQYSYKEWLDKFSFNLISQIKESKIQEVLYACSYIFKYNTKLAEYLLPHAIIYVITQQPSHTLIIKRELMAIMDEDVGVSTQDLDNVYAEDVRGSIQTLNFQCANMVFCTMDAICRLDNLSRGKEPAISLPVKHCEYLREFIRFIPKDKLATLAYKCRSHARALCYFEQYLTENKDHIDKYASALQRIYVALDDTHEASAMDMIRTSPTTIADDIPKYEACGRYEKAFICCTTSLDCLAQEDFEREPLVEDSLRCLSNQGNYQSLYERSRQMVIEYPHFKRTIVPYAVEATWKLGKWDELETALKNDQSESLLDFASVSQGYLLLSSVESRRVVPERLKIVRQKMMKPLSIALMDRSAYFRGYQNLLTLHSIGDFALAMDILDEEFYDTQDIDENTIDSMRTSLSKHLDSLFEIWNKRNKLVQPSLLSLEPLLVWQRSICQIFCKKYPFLQDKINIDIGRMWLTSADSAREARSFDRSFFCLTQARRWFGPNFDTLDSNLRTQYILDQAKLDWEQGDKTKAIRCLKLSLERMRDHDLTKHLKSRIIRLNEKDPFPPLNRKQTCKDCRSFDQQELESFAKLKMLLTHYSEEAAAGIPETLFYMYEECVHLGVDKEETYFRLARYYDRLLTHYMENPKLLVNQKEEAKGDFEPTQKFSQNLVTGEKEDVYTKLMEHSIIAFGNSLKYGVRYLRESMPRLLNIWYDLGCKKPRATQPGTPRTVSSRIESTIRFIDELKNDCLHPSYFMSALSLILSKVCHPHSGVSKKTCEILELLLINYPHQISWQMISMKNDDENDDRKKAARQIFNNCKKRGAAIEKIINDTENFSKIAIEISKTCTPFDDKNKDDKKKRLSGIVPLSELSEAATKFDFSRATILAPIESSMRPILPMDIGCNNYSKHVVFPEDNLYYIRAFGTHARVFNSLQQPRMISIHCQNGKSVQVLFKCGDDLRKDSRCVEFLNLVSRVLRRDKQSNARFFDIRTFLVLPLAKVSGIIEIVPDCDSLKNILEPLYREKDANFNMQIQPPGKLKDSKDATIILNWFLKSALPKAKPPQLPNWFLRNFTEPTSWYMARLAFTRSYAVSSMAGYIIGLGDRHLDNMLLDKRHGRVVQVDYNLLFHQGEHLPIPELVPFRLTQNIVAAFGSAGTEGNFRKVCEIVMRVMRKEKDALLTTLKPFMSDPCTEWVKVREPRDRGIRSDIDEKHENKTAKLRIEICERKLKGFPRSRRFKTLTMIDSYSVEAQVDNLIEEASDLTNICQMYWGWLPHI